MRREIIMATGRGDILLAHNRDDGLIRLDFMSVTVDWEGFFLGFFFHG